MSTEFYPDGIAILPSYILSRHNEIIEKFGLERVIKDKKFQKVREVYQTARYAIGMTAKTGTIYWVSPANEHNQTPDTFLISMPESKSRNIHIECVEVTLWEEHVDNLWEIIEKKITKSYPSHFSIVIHIEKPSLYLESKYVSDIIMELKKHKISSGAVRFWCPINKDGKDTLIGEIYPSDNYTEFDTQWVINNYYDNIHQKTLKLEIESGYKNIIFDEEDINIELPNISDIEL